MKSKSIWSKLVIILLIASMILPNFNGNFSIAKAAEGGKVNSHEPPIIPLPTSEEPTTPSYYSAPEVQPSEEVELDEQQARKSDSLASLTASVHSAVYDKKDSGDAQLLQNISVIKAKYTNLPAKGNRMLSVQEPTLSREQIRSLLILGASVEDIYEAAYLSQESGIVPDELYKEKKEKSQSWDKLRLSTTGKKATLSSVTDDVYGVTSEVYGLADTLFSDNFLLTSMITSFSSANTLLAQTNSVISEAQMQSINQTKKPQYSDRSSSNEIIDPASGSLVWKDTQISLPGRDGLDLNIGVIYNSSQSSAMPGSLQNFLADQYELGFGWGFRFPTLQKNLWGGEIYYHNGEGGVYQVDFTSPQGLKDYKSKDLRFAEDNYTFSNGQDSSRYYIEYADKKREYFGGANLRLLGIVDRFGNKIVFNYTSIQDKTYSNPSSYLLSEITDSIGRKIQFKYDVMDKQERTSYYDTRPDENLEVSVKDLQGNEVEKVTYIRGRTPYMLHKINYYTGTHDQIWWGMPTISLKSIAKQNGEQVEQTKFQYDDNPIAYDPERKEFSNGSSPDIIYTRPYRLSSVEYPHSRTTYEYTDKYVNYGIRGAMRDRVISSRYDQVFRNGVASGEYNKVKYEYTGSYDGYPAYYENRTDAYQYSTKVTTIASSLEETYLYNGKGQLLSLTRQAANAEKIVQKNTAFHSVIDTLPTVSETLEYGPGDTDANANKLYTYTEFDDWGSPLTSTRPLTDAQRNNPTLKTKNTTTYTYDPAYQLLKSKSWYTNEDAPAPFTESYMYTDKGRVQSVTNAAGETTTYAYEMSPADQNWVYKVVAEKMSGGKKVAKNVVTYGEATKYAYPTLEEAYFNIGLPNQQIIKKTTEYYMGTGQIYSVKDGNGKTTIYTYDALGRPTQITYPEFTNQDGQKYGIVEKYTYKSKQISTNFDTENTGVHSLAVDSYRTIKRASDGAESTTHGIAFYNGLGLLLLEEKWDAYNGKFVKNQFHYDSLGHPIYSIDDAGNTLKAGYDAWGRQNRATDAKEDVYVSDYVLKTRTSTSYLQSKINESDKWNYVQTVFDAWGNKTEVATYKDWPTNKERISETYKYDLAGNVVGYTDPNRNMNENNETTSYTYDALGRLSTVKDALNQTTRYAYDGNGQISKVTIQAKNGSEQTLNNKTYNEIGLIDTKQDSASQTERFTYNALGQLNSKTDRNGSTFSYDYDEVGQLKSSRITGFVNGNSQSQEMRVNFGESGPTNHTIKTFTNNVQTASQSQNLDSLNQVRSTYSVAGDHSSNIINQYDVLGRMTSIQDQYMGFYTNYKYNKHQLQKVQTNGSSTVNDDTSVNVEYSYSPNNLVNTITYPKLADSTILKTSYTYKNALGWIESMTNTKGSTVLSTFSYEYDNNGNQTAITELRSGAASQTTRYKYDALNRLQTITRQDGRKIEYTYDVRGNRQTLSDTGPAVSDIVDTSYTYDFQNTLISVTKAGSTTKFEYYADGLRYAKITGNTRTQVNYNQNGQVIAEEKVINGSFVEQASFVRGDRVLVKKDKKASKDYYYLYNGHGDVVQIVNTSGAVVNNYVYDEWGNITSQTEGVSNSFKYAGESYDPETGLYYLRARYYDPSIGRFLNEDTYEGQIDNPLSQNLYTYVSNNPLRYSDPTGNMPKDLLNAIFSAYTKRNDTKRMIQAVLTTNGENGIYQAFHEITQVIAGKAIYEQTGLSVQLEYHLEKDIEWRRNKHYWVDIVSSDYAMWEVKPRDNLLNFKQFWDGIYENAEAQLNNYASLNSNLTRGQQFEDINGIEIVGYLKMNITFHDKGKILYDFYLDLGEGKIINMTTLDAAYYVQANYDYGPDLSDFIQLKPGKRKK